MTRGRVEYDLGIVGPIVDIDEVSLVRTLFAEARRSLRLVVRLEFLRRAATPCDRSQRHQSDQEETTEGSVRWMMRSERLSVEFHVRAGRFLHVRCRR